MTAASACITSGTATFQVTFRTEGLQLVYVSDTLNHKALGYALVQVGGGQNDSQGNQFPLALTYPSYITLGAPFAVTMSSSPTPSCGAPSASDAGR